MATFESFPNEDKFVLELRRVREEIQHNFAALIDCVTTRECELLKELDTILSSYHEYQNKVHGQSEKIRELEIMLNSYNQEPKILSVKLLHEKIVNQIQDEIKLIEKPIEPKMFYFVFDSNKILSELKKLGKLVEHDIKKVDLKLKLCPAVSVCKKGSGMEEIGLPWGVTVDGDSGNIYVADHYGHCVKVFDNSGKFLFKFGDSDDEGKMRYPACLAISGNRILITINHSLLHYQLSGNFISRIGSFGNGRSQFNCPRGIAPDKTNGNLYICDCSNNRIQIFTHDFTLKSQFGADKLNRPRDVKLTKEFIYIMDESDPCLHLYDYNLILQKSVISKGEVSNPHFFFIDDSNTFIISDYGSNTVHVFNSKFESIHKINTDCPMGVAIDNQGRVVVVRKTDVSCLQIF